jgi:hypothetical protein
MARPARTDHRTLTWIALSMVPTRFAKGERRTVLMTAAKKSAITIHQTVIETMGSRDLLWTQALRLPITCRSNPWFGSAMQNQKDGAASFGANAIESHGRPLRSDHSFPRVRHLYPFRGF